MGDAGRVISIAADRAGVGLCACTSRLHGWQSPCSRAPSSTRNHLFPTHTHSTPTVGPAGVRLSQLSLSRGESARHKVLRVSDLSPDEVFEKIKAALGGRSAKAKAPG